MNIWMRSAAPDMAQKRLLSLDLLTDTNTTIIEHGKGEQKVEIWNTIVRGGAAAAPAPGGSQSQLLLLS